MKAIGYACSARSISGRGGSDSLSLQICEAEGERVVFAAIARAGGQKEQADIAGATAVKLLREWFETYLLSIYRSSFDTDQVHSELMNIVRQLTRRVHEYGVRNRNRLQIDVSAALFTDGLYYIMLCNEARAIKINSQAYEPITIEHADVTTATTTSEYCSGQVKKGDLFLLYSKEIDNVYSPEDLFACFEPAAISDALAAKMRLSHLTEACGHQLGLGNSSAILIHFLED